METGRRKKFCLSKRVEEYHFIESESSEQSNSEEDYTSICKIFHQKALKRSRQLEIEEKFKNEFQRHEANIAKFPQLQSNSSDEECSTTNTYSTRASSSRAFTSTPRVANALRPINKTLALSQIETNQTLPNSFRTVNHTINHATVNQSSYKQPANNEEYQEPFTAARTARKSNMKRRQSMIPFERLRQLANDSPYMSPLSPNPAQAKRMKRRATMMSTFKTYCEINTQTSPLEEQQQQQRGRKSITFNDGLTGNNNGNKSDSSASVISFSRAFVDEPEDTSIYINKNESRNELKLNGQQRKSDSEHYPTAESVPLNRVSRSNLSRKSKSSSNLDVNSNSFIFEPPVQSDRRSTAVPSSFKTPNRSSLSSGRKSIPAAARNSEILSDQIESTELSSASAAKSRSRISKNSSKAAAQDSSASTSKRSSNRSSLRMANSEIKSIDASASSRRSAQSNSAIKTLPGDLDDPEEEEDQREDDANESVDVSRKSSRTSRLSSSQVSSTPKLSRASTSLSIQANGRKSEIVSRIGTPSASSSRIVLNGDSEIRSRQSFGQSVSSKQPSRMNSEIKSLPNQSTNSNQESSSAASYKSASDIFLNGEIVNKSEIVTSDESNVDESGRSHSNESHSSELHSSESHPSESNSNEPPADRSMEVEESSEIDIQVNNDSNISLAMNAQTATTSATTDADDVSSTSAAKENSEIVTNYAADLDDSSKIAESENRNSVGKSAIPDFSLDDDYEVNEDFNSQNLNEDGDQRHSKIENEEDEENEENEVDQEESDQKNKEANDEEDEMDDQEESLNEVSVDLGNEESKRTETEEKEESINELSVDLEEEKEEEEEEEESKRTENVSISKGEALSDLKNSSFSRIEANFSQISVSFEPSIDNSTANHLDKNRSELTAEQNDERSSKQQDSEFKVPAPPKRPANKQRQAIQKQQPKFYETMVNKTPTIIYPQKDEREEADEDEGPVRRSSRIRVKPLEYWRNQKLMYKIDSETKCFTIEGVEKGFKPENPFSKKSTRPPTSSNKRKLKQRRSKLPKIKEERASSGSEEDEEAASSSEESESSSDEEREPVKKVRYAANEESIHQPLNESALATSEKIKKEAVEFYSKQDLVWNKSKASEDVFIALMNRKRSNTGTQASGFIKFKGFAEKPRQTSAEYVTKYVVMFGAVSVQIGEKPNVILKSMESFTVDKQTAYSIRNLRKDESLLYFDVCKS